MDQIVRRRLLRTPVLQAWRTLTTVRKGKKFSVDRTGLVNFTEEEVVESAVPASIKVIKEALSPLAKDLQSYIKLKGPISLHDYMAQSLNHLVHGYYQGNETPSARNLRSCTDHCVYYFIRQGRERL
jgi:uncharacterized protein with HEPN domain